MKHARFQRLYRDQSSEAKKVYDVMPKSEGWTAQQVLNELIRKQRPMRLEVIAGCLGHLAHVGLAKQSGNRYQLVPVEVEVPTGEKSTIVIPNACVVKVEPDALQTTINQQPKDKAMANKTEPADVTILGIFEKLNLRAAALETKLINMTNEALQLRQDIEQAALDVAAIADKDAAEMVKLRRLSAAIKDLA